MTCDEVRELLPEHLLGPLEGPEDLEVRRHLRGCAGCRTDMTALSEGVAWFAHAAHDRTPPHDLHDRVHDHAGAGMGRRPRPNDPTPGAHAWIGRAAAVVAIAATLGWGLSQAHRASVTAADAQSYRNVLSTLGGKEFRVGTLDSQRRASDRGQRGAVRLATRGSPGASCSSARPA